jgi:sensor histidine kinase YesM
MIAFNGILHQVYTYYFVIPTFDLDASESLWNWSRISKRTTYLTTPMVIATAAVLFQFYYRQNEMVRALKNEKVRAELKSLKAQLNPHFFFNTLNNLYSLALKKSDQTPEMILKLANLMRYTLDNSDRDKVRLEEELTFIKNYIDIEQQRFGARAPIAWNVNITNQSLMIPPLTLITFVENAFKHGVSASRQPVQVEISLAEENDSLIYTVSNPLPSIPNKSDGNSQIGLVNFKQRMELIYGKDFSLTISSNGIYRATMKIPKSR